MAGGSLTSRIASTASSAARYVRYKSHGLIARGFFCGWSFTLLARKLFFSGIVRKVRKFFPGLLDNTYNGSLLR